MALGEMTKETSQLEIIKLLEAADSSMKETVLKQWQAKQSSEDKENTRWVWHQCVVAYSNRPEDAQSTEKLKWLECKSGDWRMKDLKGSSPRHTQLFNVTDKREGLVHVTDAVALTCTQLCCTRYGNLIYYVHIT